jgi:peptide chain release factor subunit 1
MIRNMQPRDSLLEIHDDDLVPVTEIDVKNLAGIYDEQEVYLSAYLPVSGRENEHLNRIFVDSRIKAIRQVLSPELRELFESTLGMAEEYISSPPISGEKGRIVFACAPESFLRVYRLAVEPERSFVLDTSPFLLPLARLRGDYEDYGVLLVDSREARFTCIRSDIAEEREHLSTDLMNKHKKGGWSQSRFNHLRQGAIKAFLSEVADNVRNTCGELDTKGFVIAGPGNAKQQLLEMLSGEERDKVLGLVNLPMEVSRDELVEAGDSVLREKESETARMRTAEFRREVLTGGLAAGGVVAVRDALEQGRVNTLLILKEASVPGWICERCQQIRPNEKPPAECDRCGGPTSVVDVVEELYELAQRTGADVEFVDREDFPDPDYSVGALLRY